MAQRACSNRWGFLVVAVLQALVGFADSPRQTPENTAAQQKRALARFNSLIGGWRGVGMPRRNSTRGAWIESADWAWDFSDGKTAIRYVVKNGKQLQSAWLTFDPHKKMYHLDATFSGKTERRYSGEIAGKKLVLTSAAGKDGYVYRLTINRLNEKRTLVLHERRRAKATQFFRVAEVGYTRNGTSLAVAGADGPECVVTGGKGTIRVSYKGKTYYVCCSGCKQAFEDDPEGVLADYRKRLAERKKKRKQK